MDNLVFERVWEDNEFFMLNVSASSLHASVCGKIYTTDAAIAALSDGICDYCDKKRVDLFWENGKKGDGYTTYLSLRFLVADRLGHAKIEVFCEIADGGSYEKHNSCFYLSTDCSALYTFAKGLLTLCTKGTGKKIALCASQNVFGEIWEDIAMKMALFDKLIEKHKVQTVGSNHGDLIIPPSEAKEFINGLTKIGIRIQYVAWWCHCTDKNRKKYGCPHGYGGPKSIYFDGYFSEMCHYDKDCCSNEEALKYIFKEAPKEKFYSPCLFPSITVDESTFEKHTV